MKKSVWAGLAVLLAGGAFMAATAVDKKAEPAVEKTAEAPAPQATEKPSGSPFKNPADAKKAAAKVTEPTIEPVLLGKADAPIVMEEFASLTCSHCAHFHKDTLPELTKKYLDTGKVQLHWNSFVRNEQDMRATMLIYCVKENDKRQGFIKALLDAQDQWAFDADFLKNLRVMAQVGGVSNEQFDACMADKGLEEKLLKNREYGIGLGVSSTPYFVIGKDKTAVTGARDIKDFSEAIEAEAKADTK